MLQVARIDISYSKIMAHMVGGTRAEIVMSGYVPCIICRRMVLDHVGHGFPIRWTYVLSTLLQDDGIVYCWALTILAELYDDIHMFMYRTQQTMGLGLTLLMVWSWEHIGVL